MSSPCQDGGDGAGCFFASRWINRGRSGFPDLARSDWHCVSPHAVALSVGRSSGHSVSVPNEEDVDWVAISAECGAQGVFLKVTKRLDSRSRLRRPRREATSLELTSRGGPLRAAWRQFRSD